MSNNEELTKKEQSNTMIAADVVPGFANRQSMALAIKAGEILARSTLVPKEFHDNVPNCIIAINMSNRMGADPLMVMQNLYIVYNRPSWSSQFLISTVNCCGRFNALRYEWTGEKGKDSWGCRAWAIEKATGEKLVGSEVTIDIAKKEGWHSKNGSKWPTMPEQMLMYRAASWWVRAYAPELAMGMQTEDEIRDTIDLNKDDYEVKVVNDIRENANKEVIDLSSATVEEPVTQQKQPETNDTVFQSSDEKDVVTDGPGY